jgi:hypothetical protein
MNASNRCHRVTIYNTFTHGTSHRISVARRSHLLLGNQCIDRIIQGANRPARPDIVLSWIRWRQSTFK